MPLLKHAKKKMRQDKNRAAKNKIVRARYKDLLKKAAESKKEADVRLAFSAVDKAAKQNIIHENKAGRLKSALNRSVSEKTDTTSAPKKETKKTTKTSSKKSPVTKSKSTQGKKSPKSAK